MARFIYNKRWHILSLVGLATMIVLAAGLVLNRRPERPDSLPRNFFPPTVIQLRGVHDQTLSGRSTRVFATQGVQAAFLHTLRVELPEPPKPEIIYTGWLAKADKSHYIKTGILVKHQNGEYKMDFRDSRDYADYPLVAVTAETKDDDAPELTLLEGRF